MDCIFCAIIVGEKPSHKLHEDDHVVAFLDIFPSVLGHTLVVPKKHSENVLGLDPAEAEAAIVAIQKLAPGIVKAVGAEGFNIGCNTGKAAGQMVMHTHFHILPRREGDGKKLWGQMDPKPDLVALAEQIREML
jgi:histidine triad (HIT) family protein